MCHVRGMKLIPQQQLMGQSYPGNNEHTSVSHMCVIFTKRKGERETEKRASK